MYRMIVAFCHSHQRLDLNVHIDDAALQADGANDEEALDEGDLGAVDLHAGFAALDLPLAQDKLVCVGSSAVLVARAQSRLGWLAGKCCRVARHLGVDFVYHYHYYSYFP